MDTHEKHETYTEIAEQSAPSPTVVIDTKAIRDAVAADEDLAGQAKAFRAVGGAMPPDSSHPAPDNDPYGWIAAQEADERPTVQSSTGEQVPVRTAPYVIVEQIPALSAPDKFDYAVAKVLPNGVLLVTPRGSEVPLKGYAPGAWATFEHVGPEYHQRPPLLKLADREAEPSEIVQWRQRQAADDRKKAEEYAQRRKENDQFVVAVLADSQRRTPPTLEQDADDDTRGPHETGTTHSAADSDEATNVGGGGVQAPKALSGREAAEPTDLTPRPSGDVPDEDEEPTPGRLRSLWRYLTDPDWVKD